MLTAVIILGIMLAGITGYLVWSTVHDRYVKAEDIGAFKDSAPDMGVPGGSGHGGLAEGRPEDGDSLHGNRGGNEPWDSSGPWNPASDGQPADAGDGQGPGTAGDSLENGLGTAGSGQDMGDEGAGADGTDDSTIHFVFAGDSGGWSNHIPFQQSRGRYTVHKIFSHKPGKKFCVRPRTAAP